MAKTLVSAFKDYWRALFHSRTNAQQAKTYAFLPSLVDEMGLVEWDDEENVGLLNDGRSLIAFLEVKDLACETYSPEQLQALYQTLKKWIAYCVPIEAVNPWTVSFYVQDEMTLTGLEKRLKAAVKPALKDDPLTTHFIDEVMSEHFRLLCQPQGLFEDPMSGVAFRGRSRRIRIALCRVHKREINGFDYRVDGLNELHEVVVRVKEALQGMRLKVTSLHGKQVYHWLTRWFNPHPESTEGDVEALLAKRPYLTPAQRPFGWSLMQAVFHAFPKSLKRGWAFDGIEHRVLVLRECTKQPKLGAITRERELAGKRAALMDYLPPGSVYVMHCVFEDKDTIDRHLTTIRSRAIGRSKKPREIKRDVDVALEAQENENRLIRTTQAIYFRGEDEVALNAIERHLKRLLNDQANLEVIDTRYDLYPLDSYLRFLPGNFDPVFAKRRMRVGNYLYASDLACLLPFYGRFRGDERHVLFPNYNRGGEGVYYNPYHTEFKSNNAHMVLFGTTGAGKSVLLNYMTLLLLSVNHSRVVILEAGGSFDLLTLYLLKQNKRVKYLKFSKATPMAINPFAEAYALLAQVNKEQAEREAVLREQQVAGLTLDLDAEGLQAEILADHAEAQAKLYEELNQLASEKEQQADQDRDLLNEMALVVSCMVTGGNAKEEAALTRADRGRINKVILATAARCYEAGKEQVLTEDILEGFQLAATAHPDPMIAQRLNEFAESLSLFTTGDLAIFFNRPAQPIGDFDYFHIDLGFLKNNGQETGLSVVAISVLSRVLGLAEAHQRGDRSTIFIMDEAHLLFKNPSIAAFAVLMAKVARKIGLWLIIATQNITDLSGNETKKLLSMMENWLCLALSNSEIELIPQFRTLTDEQQRLLGSVKKYAKLYSEAVLLAHKYQGILRNIPPRLCLALAMTEQNEKARLRQLANEYGYDNQWDAIEHQANDLKQHRNTLHDDNVFDD